MTSPTFWRNSRNESGERLAPRVFFAVTMALTLLSFPVVAHEVDDHFDESQQALRDDANDTRVLLQAFRETGEDEFLDRAWTLIKPRLEAEPENPDTLLDAALVAQARHHFSYALQLTQKALGIRPNNNQAWLLLASIHLVRGETAAARTACQRLLGVPLLLSLGCQARVALSGDDVRRAFERYARVVELSASSGQDTELLPWSLSVAGDLAVAAGEPEQAIQFFTRSLQLAESTQVRSALVDVLIEVGDLENAASVIAAGAPALPLEIRRMLVAKRLGQDVARDIHRADHKFRHWIADEDWLHAREMARFYMDVLERPELAKRLAEINLGLQREPEDLLLARRADM